MAKYSRAQLKQIAIDTVAIEGTPKYLNGIMQICIKTGLTPVQVEQRIRNYANG